MIIIILLLLYYNIYSIIWSCPWQVLCYRRYIFRYRYIFTRIYYPRRAFEIDFKAETIKFHGIAYCQLTTVSNRISKIAETHIH